MFYDGMMQLSQTGMSFMGVVKKTFWFHYNIHHYRRPLIRQGACWDLIGFSLLINQQLLLTADQ